MDEDYSMQAVYGVPGPVDMKGNISSLSLQEGSVNVVLKRCGRVTVSESEAGGRAEHRTGVRGVVGIPT